MRILFAMALAMAMAPALAGCSQPDAPPAAATSTGKPFATRLDGPAKNMARIHDGLYRGAQPDDGDLKALRDLGIKTIVNLRSNHSERKEAEALGFRFHDIPMHADIFGSTPPDEAKLKRFFEIVLVPANQPVYFHCAHGKDRTGTLAAVYRIEIDGWTAEEAIEEMQAFGYHDIYKDLIEFVRTYRPRGFKRE
jgi:tyrosine-protein phosphatase SIW14